MRNIFILIIALGIKLIIGFVILTIVNYFYDYKTPIYWQNFIIWILLYLPFMIGIERIINILFKSKEPKIKTTFEERIKELQLEKKRELKFNKPIFPKDRK